MAYLCQKGERWLFYSEHVWFAQLIKNLKPRNQNLIHFPSQVVQSSNLQALSPKKKRPWTQRQMFLHHQSNHQLLSLLTIRSRASAEQHYTSLPARRKSGQTACLGKIKRPSISSLCTICEADGSPPVPPQQHAAHKPENTPLCYSSNPLNAEILLIPVTGALFTLHLYPMCAWEDRHLVPSIWLSTLERNNGSKHERVHA